MCCSHCNGSRQAAATSRARTAKGCAKSGCGAWTGFCTGSSSVRHAPGSLQWSWSKRLAHARNPATLRPYGDTRSPLGDAAKVTATAAPVSEQITTRRDRKCQGSLHSSAQRVLACFRGSALPGLSALGTRKSVHGGQDRPVTAFARPSSGRWTLSLLFCSYLFCLCTLIGTSIVTTV